MALACVEKGKSKTMKRIVKILSVALVLTLLSATLAPLSNALDRNQRQAIMKSSVLIYAMKVEGGKVAGVAWTGSGTIVDARGLIVTNYHVVEESKDWNTLGVLMTTRSDRRPEPSYQAVTVAKDPQADLAVIKIISDFSGKAVDNAKLNLPIVPLGDADSLEIGDELFIFGYPSIGNGTITFTEGKVSGFLEEDKIAYTRAWIKTDASISGGNSGGAAIDADGKLVGVPTQVGQVDARRLADTNKDGVIDEKDAAISTGGFINKVRPINLAYPLITQAQKALLQGGGTQPNNAPKPTTPSTPAPTAPAPKAASFSPFVFATQIDANRRPIDPGASFPPTTTQLIAVTQYVGMVNGASLSSQWSIDGEKVAGSDLIWGAGPEGAFSFTISNGGDPLPAGKYTLKALVGGVDMQTGSATIAAAKGAGKTPPQTSRGVTVSGYLADGDTDEPIAGALVGLLKPGVTVARFAKEKSDALVAAFGMSDEDGYYELTPPVARDQVYSVIIVADGSVAIAEDDALEITADDPDEVELETIWMAGK